MLSLSRRHQRTGVGAGGGRSGAVLRSGGGSAPTVRARAPDLRGPYPLAARAANLASFERVAATTLQERLGAICGQQVWERDHAAVEILGADDGAEALP